MIEWDSLRIILAIGRNGSLSAAARELGINHTTVSRRLASAEQQLKTRLFDRRGKQMEATQAGVSVQIHAARMERAVLDMNRALAAADDAMAGPLKITAPQLLIQSHLAAIVARFAEDYPSIEIHLDASNDIVSLHNRDIDVALRISDTPDPSLFGRRIARQNRCYYAARGLARTLGPDSDVPCLAFRWWGPAVPGEVLQILPKARPGMMFDDMTAALSVLKTGAGIARLPCFVGDADPALDRIPGFSLTRYMDVWILTHPDLKGSEKVRRFMRYAGDRIAARKADFTGIRQN
ncbi:MAG: LysR family transcriptional regulator [Nitratireductor sp.]|nr:LysR family transcriptional regulator [Nitratireductor sp.]